MEVLTLCYLEYLPGGKVDSEGLRILLRGEDDCTRQVLTAAAFPIPLLKGTWREADFLGFLHKPVRHSRIGP
jgi:hypothetical protein